MLYLTYNVMTNKLIIIFGKSREHTAYALRSPKISREHTRMPAYHCHYNTVCTTTRKKVDNKLEERRLNISRYKAVYLRINGNGNLGDNLERVITFKYLGAK